MEIQELPNKEYTIIVKMIRTHNLAKWVKQQRTKYKVQQSDRKK